MTSQLFANIYLNELDKFIKHDLRQKYYLRYCDDFVILSDNLPSPTLPRCQREIEDFLEKQLNLKLHPDKIVIRKLRQGIDFLGYVVLPYHRVLRTKTKRRMLKRFNAINAPSYLGLLKHSNSYKVLRDIIQTYEQES